MAAQAFFRIVRTSPATVSDFRSYRELGMPLFRDTPTNRRRWEGVSVYETFEQAVKQARQLEFKFGGFVAEVVIPDDNLSISMEPGRPQSGHRTVHSEPVSEQAERLLDHVVAVHQIGVGTP